MSYSIYYDRAFVRVDDKYIPLVNSGSNNCFEYGFNGRMIAEKDWEVLNWKHRKRLLFTEIQIKAIARRYDRYSQESGMLHKSRHQHFGAGEFERWVVNGMRRAYTIEEYVRFGNSFHVIDYSSGTLGEQPRYPVRTTAELLNILDMLKHSKEIGLKLGDNRSVYRPTESRTRSLRPGDLPEYYVLKGDLRGETIYFVRLTKRGIKYIPDRPGSRARVFRTEKEALRYLSANQLRLQRADFSVERITAA